MSRLRVSSFTIPLDGYGAGPDQSREHPLGVGGETLHEWFVPTRTSQRMHGGEDGETGVDDDFVAEGIRRALELAREAAGDRDVLLGGGVATIRQYLQARLIDELHLAAAPILLGAGESLFAGLDLPALGYRVVEHTAAPRATHVVLRRSAA